jgi:hypothetical protein
MPAIPSFLHLSSRRLEVDFGQFAALSVDGRYLRDPAVRRNVFGLAARC